MLLVRYKLSPVNFAHILCAFLRLFNFAVEVFPFLILMSDMPLQKGWVKNHHH